MFEGKHTGFGTRAPLHSRMIKAQLNYRLGMLYLTVEVPKLT